MKLRNKKTGEIIEVESCSNTGGYISIYYEEKDGQIGTKDCYTSLAKLNEEWEDAPEEPKENWTISGAGYLWTTEHMSPDTINDLRRIGNLFETKEEAEQAVKKLKAWKRLKDKGFRFTGVEDVERAIRFEIPFRAGYDSCEAEVDLDLLFSGGEE